MERALGSHQSGSVCLSMGPWTNHFPLKRLQVLICKVKPTSMPFSGVSVVAAEGAAVCLAQHRAYNRCPQMIAIPVPRTALEKRQC